jgi:hypothetical protein
MMTADKTVGRKIFLVSFFIKAQFKIEVLLLWKSVENRVAKSRCR